MSDTGIVSIHGKQYETVALRVRKFRTAHPSYTLSTEIVSRDEECVVMLAKILDESGRLIATGHSEEYRKSSQINRTSALENAETSAIGRALAAFGLGGTEFATADEVANAIVKQPKSGRAVAAVTFEEMDQDTQKHLAQIADGVRNELNERGPEAALALLNEQQLDADQKVACWSLFSSQERSALKAANKKAA